MNSFAFQSIELCSILFFFLYPALPSPLNFLLLSPPLLDSPLSLSPSLLLDTASLCCLTVSFSLLSFRSLLTVKLKVRAVAALEINQIPSHHITECVWVCMLTEHTHMHAHTYKHTHTELLLQSSTKSCYLYLLCHSHLLLNKLDPPLLYSTLSLQSEKKTQSFLWHLRLSPCPLL